jgi:hypothetical protein
MGLLWYLAAILVWWLISGILGGGHSHIADVGFMIAATAFFYGVWWLPYISWIAFGEFHFFWKYPERKAPFFVFAILSFAAYLAVALYFPNSRGLWPLLVWPAAVVTFMYMLRRILRA